MSRIDVLGYGNLLTLDGFRATSASLAEISEIEALLTELGELLDPSGAPRIHVEASGDGVSGLLVSAESQIFVHVFPEHQRVVFKAFSRRILPVITLSERVRVRFDIGRLESQVRQRTVLIPPERDVPAQRVVSGERAYARLRVLAPATV